MITPCPHCSAQIEIDPATHATLVGHSHFVCPSCQSAVPLPAPVKLQLHPVPGSQSKATNGPWHKVRANQSKSRATNRNLLILGTTALLVLGGIAFVFASRKPGGTHNTTQDIRNEIINNSYFQNLINTGLTTKEDLDDIAAIRPYGDGFVGVSKDHLTSSGSRRLADRAASTVFDIENNNFPSDLTFRNWLTDTFDDNASFPIWIKKSDKFGHMEMDGFESRDEPEQRFPVLIYWSKDSVIKTINLKNMMDVTQNVLFGNWKSDEEGLRVSGNPNGLMRLPLRPKGNYELEIEFTRTLGGSHVIVVLPLKNNAVAAFVGGSAGHISMVNNRDLAVTKVRSQIMNQARCILNLVVDIDSPGRVRIHGKINGSTCVEWSGPVSSLSQNGYWRIAAPVSIGLGVHGSSVIFHRLSIRTSTGSDARTPSHQ